MKNKILVLAALLSLLVPAAHAQSADTLPPQTLALKPAAPQPLLFPHNWIRGYADVEVAPSHNEPDLGRCMFPQPVSAGGTASQCTAYARYLFFGYLELQPIGRTVARHFFLFLEPRMFFGNNLPQLKYTASIEPISFDRSIGVGFQLQRNLQLRLTQHQVDYLGRYGGSLGPADLHTAGPYGLYATVGVRWTFGGYGGQSGSPY